MNDILLLFPEHVQKILQKIEHIDNIEEVRIRIFAPIEVITRDAVFYPGEEADQFYVMTEDDIEYIFNQLSEFSMYAFQEELKQGFITTKGGHRVGVGGQVVYENGKVLTMKHIRFLNIRLASDQFGSARVFTDKLYQHGYDHTLVIGAPQSGKTTFLRDAARAISDGVPEKKIPPKKVAIIDERSEIAACYQGVPSFEVGKRTDVLDSCLKSDGMMMMIRAMSPEVIIVDEIGRKEDAEAIMEAVHAGVTVICTAHGHSIEAIKKRPAFKYLFETSVFRYIVTLERCHGAFTIHVEDMSNYTPERMR